MGIATRAALVLPDVDVRREFAELIGNLPGVDLAVSDVLKSSAVPDSVRDVEILFTFGQFINDEILDSSSLRWIQGLGSGVDGLIDRKALRPETIITSARGVHSVCVSETAMCLMLAMARDLPKLMRNQSKSIWETGPARLLHGKTVGILGVGQIAEGLAARCRAFGMRVEGVSSRAEAPDFDALFPYDALADVVSRFDYFVLLAPLSAVTRNIVNADVLRAMRPDAFLINVARGGVVDDVALIEALTENRIAGAALDVFAVEPLPVDSPIWLLPNVLVSPHAAGQHRDYALHVMPIIENNLAAFREGRTRDLINRIVPGSGGPAD